MTLTTAQIIRQLDASRDITRDNTAQDIINDASTGDLRALDARGIYMLVVALDDGWNSTRDNAAKRRLRTYSQFQLSHYTKNHAVAAVKACTTVAGNAAVVTHLSGAAIGHLYAEEHSRLSWGEGGWFDGDTIGRGQLGQAAFTDVLRQAPDGFRDAWAAYSEGYYAAKRMNADNGISNENRRAPNFNYTAPTTYSQVYAERPLEDFVVAAYLALKMKAATRPARSAVDAARFGVAVYHGMYSMLRAAQIATGDDTNWAPVEAHLRANGNADACDYVTSVVR